MTAKELNQLYWLNKETARMQKDLQELRQKGINCGGTLTGMPKSNGRNDIIGDYVSEIVILEETIKLNMQKIYYERNQLERYIADIPDAEIRLIMRLRHINGMKFGDIGEELGYERTSVSKKYYNYLKTVSHNSHL